MTALIFLIMVAAAAFLLGWGLGYTLGRDNEREYWRRLGNQRGWFGH